MLTTFLAKNAIAMSDKAPNFRQLENQLLTDRNMHHLAEIAVGRQQIAQIIAELIPLEEELAVLCATNNLEIVWSGSAIAVTDKSPQSLAELAAGKGIVALAAEKPAGTTLMDFLVRLAVGALMGIGYGSATGKIKSEHLDRQGAVITGAIAIGFVLAWGMYSGYEALARMKGASDYLTSQASSLGRRSGTRGTVLLGLYTAIVGTLEVMVLKAGLDIHLQHSSGLVNTALAAVTAVIFTASTIGKGWKYGWHYQGHAFLSEAARQETRDRRMGEGVQKAVALTVRVAPLRAELNRLQNEVADHIGKIAEDVSAEVKQRQTDLEHNAAGANFVLQNVVFGLLGMRPSPAMIQRVFIRLPWWRRLVNLLFRRQTA